MIETFNDSKNDKMQTQNKLNNETIQDLKQLTHEQYHIVSGQYLKSAVYAGSDGVINVLSVILGGIGSGSSTYQILSLAVSIMLADGVGMALGDYLSTKAQSDYVYGEQKREFFEVKNQLQYEKLQMVTLYMKSGYQRQQSQKMAQLISTNDQAFVNIMMLWELGLVVDDAKSPFFNGIVTLIVYIVLGFLPIIPFIITTAIHYDDGSRFYYLSIIIGGFELLALGFGKAVLIGISRWKAAIQTLFFGAVAITVGYGIGLALHIKK